LTCAQRTPVPTDVGCQCRRALRDVRCGSCTMDVIEVASLSYLVLRMIKKRHHSRRWRVHPINSERYLRGQFYTLYPRLREDSNKFFNYFCMSAAPFDELLFHIKKSVVLTNTNMRCGIAPEEMLAITLRDIPGC
jgi:hypothetical protein